MATLARSGRTLAVIVLILTEQTLVCAIAALPIVATWIQLASATSANPVARAIAFALAAVPSYAAFAVAVPFVSGAASRALRWRTPPDATMRIADLEWPVLQWARYMAAIHVVRALAGPLLRGTPVWTAYLRLNGAVMGRRVYVNSLSLSDYNLLEFGDDVVIGADVHLSGHTVENGIVKTGRVVLGSGVTIGVGSIVDIGVRVGPGTQVGALSLVPKHSTLAPGAVYVGIPVHRMTHAEVDQQDRERAAAEKR